ncbi:MAG: S1 RNA-binding domain-containing protein [Clostridia bacterium]|nr:S1 RNA-binding domain-containing protein [Clostridia bacterium]
MISVGSIVEGKIMSVMPFGAFVDIGDKQSVLVHISEVSSGYVKDINDCVKKGDSVKVKIIKIDDNGKISLSIKQACEEKKEKTVKSKPEKKGPVRPADIDWSASSSNGLSFEEQLSKFKQDSDEKMQTLRRNNESKRSGGYSRKNSHSF